MVAASRGGESKQAHFGGQIFCASLPLNLGDRSASRIALLRGEVRFNIAEASERLQLDDATHAAGATRTVGSYALRLLDCQAVGRQVSYTVEIHTGADPSDLAADQHFMHLEDADGHIIDEQNGGGIGRLRNGARVYFVRVFADRPVVSPVRMVWDVATRWRRETVPFEIRDVPLMP